LIHHLIENIFVRENVVKKKIRIAKRCERRKRSRLRSKRLLYHIELAAQTSVCDPEEEYRKPKSATLKIMLESFVYRGANQKIEENLPLENLREALTDKNSFVWIDMEKPSEAEENQILTGLFDLHPLTIEDCRLNHSQPKIEEFPRYLYFIVHGVKANETDPRNFTTKELDCYLSQNFVVTYHHENFRSIDAVKRQIRASPVACQRGAAYLMHQILDRIADDYVPVIENFEAYITKLEDRIFALKKADNRMLAEILRVKRAVLRMRRISAKQLNVLYRMSHGEFPQIQENLLPFYRDVYDHLLRVSDLAESYCELVSGLMETYLSVIANRTNDIMKTLTIFSALMLPLTFITGFYGMNFENLPELHSETGYLIALGAMMITVVVMLVYFWRKGWIGASNADANDSIHSSKIDESE
jgi:magnesium transporter